MIEALAAELAQWGPGLFLKTSVWLYPLVNAVHILAIGAVLTSVLLMDASVLGFWGRSPGQQAVIALLRPVTIFALVLALASGFLLFSVRPVDYIANPVFRLKLALLALALVNALIFLAFNPQSILRKPAAALSAVLWLGVLVAGRFVGFLD
jgi:hypothetical protein